MSVPLTLLGLLEREPSHGYDLKRDYDAFFGRGRPLPFGQLYATLGRLARDGKVVVGPAEAGAGPDRKRYVITEQGATDCEAWLAEPVEAEPHLQTVLFAKVVLALLLGRDAQRYLDTQRAAHLQRMRELTEVKRTGGLVMAGPWLTMVGARLLARSTGRPTTLVAARRLAADPRSGFRAVSGLALALFVTSTAVAVMTTMIAERGAPTGDVTAGRTVVAIMLDPGAEGAGPTTVPASLLGELHSVDGSTGVVAVRRGPLSEGLRVVPWQQEASLVSCEELASVAGLGRCAPGAEAVSVPPGFDEPGEVSWDRRVWPTAPLSAAELAALQVEAVVVGTDGSTAAIERVRTILTPAVAVRWLPAAIGEQGADAGIAQQLAGFQRLADVAIIGSLCIAGCSLAASVIGGLNDRRRPFSLLRLTGVPLRVLRRVVGLETAVPLLVVAAVATAAGLLAASLFLRSQLGYELHAPGADYWLLVAAGLVASLLVVGCPLPLLRRITGPETARNE